MDELGNFGESVSDLWGDITGAAGDVWNQVVEGGGHYLKGLADQKLEEKKSDKLKQSLSDGSANLNQQVTPTQQHAMYQQQDKKILGVDATTAIVLVVGAAVLLSVLRPK